MTRWSLSWSRASKPRRRCKDEGAQDVEQPQEDVLWVPPAEPAGGQGADAVHAADHREGFGAQHRVLPAYREIGRQVCGQENEVQAADKIGPRHNEKGTMAHRLSEHRTHRGPGPGT